MTTDRTDATSRHTDDYARQAVQETVGELRSDAARGLSAGEAAQRPARIGPDEIQEKEEPLWRRIFRRFWGPIPWMIEIAAFLSGLPRSGRTWRSLSSCCASMRGSTSSRSIGH